MGRCIAITEARRQRAHIRRLQGGGLPRSRPHPVPSHSALGKEAWSSKSWPHLRWLWERLLDKSAVGRYLPLAGRTKASENP